MFWGTFEKMENNLGMKFGLKAMKYIGQNLERKSKRADDLIWGLFTANVTLCYVLSILEPMLNFEGFERLPEYLDVICNYHVVIRNLIVNIISFLELISVCYHLVFISS